MKRNPIQQKVLAFLLFLYPCIASAQLVESDRLLSFEERQIPTYLDGTDAHLSISDAHYKDGTHSLRWDYEPGAVLNIKRPLNFEKKDTTGKDLYLSTFIVWIYNEQPEDKIIRFEFLKNGKVCCSFRFGVNFKGWRSVWACYERDMEGSPEEGMDEVRIQAPNTKGELYIDHLLTAAKTDHRHQTPDVQAPFVNKHTDNHWLVVYKNSFLKPDIALTPIDELQKKEMHQIEKRFRNLIYTPSELSEKELAIIRKEYNFYQITYQDGKVKGLPIFFARAAEAYERIIPDWNNTMIGQNGMEIKDFFDLMNRIAIAYNNTSDNLLKEELRQKFLAMYAHITDQGAAYGSCMGNFTHYGYSFRGLYTSYFLMKDVLRKEGLLNEAENTMRWYAITNKVYVKPTCNGTDMDSFNTQTTGRIASILMMEDTPEKLQYLRSFSRWIDYGCRPASGLAGAFKKDGGAFHHRNNYPAYAVGGLDGATHMIYLLSNTQFSVSELAHQTVKNVLLAMRFYCNKHYFPLSMSGRHPDGQGKLIPIQYAIMAIAGTPDEKQEIDGDMAGAYLRLVSTPNTTGTKDPEYMPQVAGAKEQQMARTLIENGFRAEPDPQGNLALGYGCVSVQRRSNWSAVIRGHSRYLWAAEHYLGCNLYGRYLAHGSMQIMTARPNEEVTPLTGGWQEKGFNWARVPGTTATCLPIDKMEAKILNVDAFSGIEEMLYSDQAFAGGLSQQHMNGNFGMKLHEHDKYNGTLRACKSFHFFDNTIICLGSGIENEVSDYDTETTVFQLAITTDEGHDYWNKYAQKGNVWLDNFQTGYYYPASQAKQMKFEKHFPQYSRNEETRKETKGDWVTLTVNHGRAPLGAGYEYAVLPQTTLTALQVFSKHPTYKVLQRDPNAHIVKSLKDDITSYVLFETPQAALPKGLLQKTDTSCLVMVKVEKDSVSLTVCQPDLALYRGPSDEVFDKNGKRIERSIYSRPWIDNDSGEIAVTLTLRGKWDIKENPACRIISSGKKQTIVKVICKDGASQDIRLFPSVSK